ncbi:MAG: sarcosine oxidase subunit delta [Acidimicrobiia bacterium]
MLVIVCPHCGPRNHDEYAYQGELVSRPPVDTDPATWRRYLYMKRNEAGWQAERWFHVSGCRRFLEVERNTITNEIRRVSEVGSS